MMQNYFKVFLVTLLGSQLSSCFGVKMRNDGNDLALAPAAIIGPHLASVSVTNGNPTNALVYNLSYGATTGTYSRYCILENDTDVSNCSFVAGALPGTFAVSTTENAKTLSVWLRDSAGNTSSRVDTGAVTLDITPPSMASVTLAANPLTFSTYDLTYGAVANGPYAEYCVLENNTDVSDCSFVKGTLPLTRKLSEVSGGKVLSIWLKDSVGNVSSRIASNSVNTSVAPDLVWDRSDTHGTNRLGVVSVGRKTVPIDFHLQNYGAAAATACGTPTLSNTTDFEIVSETCGTYDIPAHQECTVTVRAKIQSPGMKTATLARTCNGVTTSTTVSGYGVTGVPTQIAAGDQLSCAVLSSGMVFCWGSYHLGDGGSGGMWSDFVSGITTATQVAVTENYNVPETACVVLADQTVRCWGENDLGTLGSGSVASESATPVAVSGLTGVIQLTAGFEFFCALQSDGRVQCWGNNMNLIMGDGSYNSRWTPDLIPGVTGAVKIAASAFNVCAVLNDGQLQCWGRGPEVDHLSPTLIAGITDAIDVAVAHATVCTLHSDQSVKCFGGNLKGEVGNGTVAAQATPVTVLNSVASIEASATTVCARMMDGSLKCWGENTYGLVGDGTTYDRPSPTSVADLPAAVTQVSVASRSACALHTDSTVSCWGSPAKVLGDSLDARIDHPTVVLTGATQISIGSNSSCARMPDGTVRCWGLGGSSSMSQDGYAFGNGVLTKAATSPITVSGITTAAEVAVGDEFACARLTDGTVSCWGANWGGALGDGTDTDRATPVQVTGLTGATQIAVGKGSSCALLSDQTVKCWGYGGDGNLGDGTTNDSFTPVLVSSLTGVTQISAGPWHTCALLADGTVKCWGYNGSGELGDGTTDDSPVPVTVAGLPKATRVVAGDESNCALLADRTVRCWGYGDNGTFLDGLDNSGPFPSPLDAHVSDVLQIAVGSTSSCVLESNGRVRCAGVNSVSLPRNLGEELLIRPAFGLTDIASVSLSPLGSETGCALNTSGVVYCWGPNEQWQTGVVNIAPRLVSGLIP